MKKLSMVLITVLLTGCYEEQNIKDYKRHLENCPKGYEVITYNRIDFGKVRYQCQKCPTKKEVNDCIKETTGYFKNLSGEFEDWDTSDIKDLVSQCKECKEILF